MSIYPAVQIFHPQRVTQHKPFGHIDAPSILRFLEKERLIHRERPYTLVFLGCGYAVSEMALLTHIVQQGYAVKRAFLLDRSLSSTTIHNIQKFLASPKARVRSRTS